AGAFREYLRGYSDSQSISDEGEIIYNTQRGIGEALPKPADPFAQYEFIRGRILNGRLRLVHRDISYQEHKDRRGHLIKMLDGYSPQQLGRDGYVRAGEQPRFGTFLSYPRPDITDSSQTALSKALLF